MKQSAASEWARRGPKVDLGLRNEIHLLGHVDGHVGHATEGAVEDRLGAEPALREEGFLPVVREALARPGLGHVEGPVAVAGPRDDDLSALRPLSWEFLFPMGLQRRHDEILLRLMIPDGVRASIRHQGCEGRLSVELAEGFVAGYHVVGDDDLVLEPAGLAFPAVVPDGWDHDLPLVELPEAQHALLGGAPHRPVGSLVETQEVHALAIVHDILLVAGFDELAAVAHRVHAAHLYPCVPGLREVAGLSRQHDLGVPDVHDIAFAVERHIAACEGRRQLRTPCYGDHCFFSKTRGLTRAISPESGQGMREERRGK